VQQPDPAVAEVLRWARNMLGRAGCDTPTLDAEVLLAHTLDQQRAWFYAHPEHHLASAAADAYAALVRRRAAGEPVAYLVGQREFFGLDFAITSAVLVPRPETELLVEICLEHLPERTAARTVVDVGTGSGVLAITLAIHLPGAHVVAVDLSPHALAVARCNAVAHGVADRIQFVQADLLPPVDTIWDVIVSNPPYLRSDEMPPPGQDTGCFGNPLAWEPCAALEGGPDGLRVIRRLLETAANRLSSYGLLVMELGAGQGPAVLNVAHRCFPHAEASVHPDYAGHDRVLVVSARLAPAIQSSGPAR
jgi:release factor glutamine methyltransferase